MHKKLAVIGYPVKHSLSPLIHNYWIDKYGFDAEYGLLETKPEDLEATLRNLKKNSYVGCNLTVPHKILAMDIVDVITDTAKIIGAVNTISLQDDGTLIGDNTDKYGFLTNLVNHIEEFRIDRPLKKAVVIGAGGAARAIVAALVYFGINEIIIVNRSQEKADIIKNDLSSFIIGSETYSSVITTQNWQTLDESLDRADLLVNTTTLGMEGQPELSINLDKLPKHAIVNDIVYKPLETSLLKKARSKGNYTVDGLGMLLYQAVGGFEQWLGKKPEVTKELRQFILS